MINRCSADRRLKIDAQYILSSTVNFLLVTKLLGNNISQVVNVLLKSKSLQIVYLLFPTTSIMYTHLKIGVEDGHRKMAFLQLKVSLCISIRVL